jgi:methenyltetrahydromethanopterin cyclohydrolase
MNLNARAAALCQSLADDAEAWRIKLTRQNGGALIVDCGIEVPGGYAAGLLLARVCLADLGVVHILGASAAMSPWPKVFVQTDQPLLACMASQYAGWEVKGDGYFAMGSGPMRAAAAREPIFEELGYRESAETCVGVLECGSLPPPAVCGEIAAKSGVSEDKLTILAAPTRSVAGSVQIVARSVETALHKLHELKFDLKRVAYGRGTAPLPPPAVDDLRAIGRTNDAILYGGRVVLHVHCDDATLEEIGPRIPSSASSDYGRPFAEILAAYHNDFYRVDPLLFSPAQIAIKNLDTGRSFFFGQINRGLLEKSFSD